MHLKKIETGKQAERKINVLAWGYPAKWGCIIEITNQFEKHKRKFVIEARTKSEVNFKLIQITTKLCKFKDESEYAAFIEEQENLYNELNVGKMVARVERKAKDNDKLAAKEKIADKWKQRKDVTYYRIYNK